MKKKYHGALLGAVATLIFANPVLAAEPAPDKCAAAPAERTLVEAEHMTVEIVGNGPDVILIPGLATPRAVWEPTVARFAGCYRLHLVQIRGFGDDAGANADGPVIEPLVAELAGYIRDRSLDHPAIVGHSLGGLSALMLGARHADLPGKIMVVDAVPFIGTLFSPAATVEIVKPQAAGLSAAIKAQHGQPRPEITADPGEASQFGRMSITPEGRIQVAKWGLVSDSRVTGQALYDDMTIDMRGELPAIKAPVTLLYAQDDNALPANVATQVFVPQYEGTASFEAKMITESRHFIMLDQPEKFAESLKSFLSK